LAYQGVARRLGIDDVLEVNTFALDGQMPDLSIFFDIEPRAGLSRIKGDKKHEINRLDVENLDFHNAVYQGYLEVVRRFKSRIQVVDARQDFESVFNKTIQIINKKIANV
jgi:dTMP kinase